MHFCPFWLAFSFCWWSAFPSYLFVFHKSFGLSFLIVYLYLGEQPGLHKRKAGLCIACSDVCFLCFYFHDVKYPASLFRFRVSHSLALPPSLADWLMSNIRTYLKWPLPNIWRRCLICGYLLLHQQVLFSLDEILVCIRVFVDKWIWIG